MLMQVGCQRGGGHWALGIGDSGFGIRDSGFGIWAWQALCWWMSSVSSMRLALPSACRCRCRCGVGPRKS
ncbi:hypothetical protein EYC54_12300 [Xanthomonas oryzae]|nr:hypothetical protein EYC54_12300 [Xanthomonas oryzae]